MPDISTIEPQSFSRGDTVQWTKTLSDYPASLWALTYEFRGAASKTIAATASGDDYAVTIAASATATWNVGTYWWEAYVTKTTERFCVASGTLQVGVNFADKDVVADHRSHAKKVLDAIEAVIENRATRDQMAYTIAGRSLQLTPLADLMTLRDRYRTEVQKEQRDELIKRGETQSHRILVRF